MTSDEIKLCMEVSFLERNKFKSDLICYLQEFIQNITLDTDYNKGFHDALKIIECHVKEI